MSYNSLLRAEILKIRDTIYSIEKGREVLYTTNFIKKNKAWYPYVSTELDFIHDFNSSLKLYPGINDNAFAYPEWSINDSLFNKVRLANTAEIDSILNKAFSKDFIMKMKDNDKETNEIYKAEKQKAFNYVNSIPIKKFTHSVNELLQ
ncbi:hypothetical protein [Marinifilum sp.]|uniref:hypothetical protein n=1 Tax=Marinifilum sp. TaxID=2033137 RepID=UPI003BAC260D